MSQQAAGETGYNFAYLDEGTKRMIRRAILKGIAIPGYQVPFASREMPMPYGWGTGGVQVTAERHGVEIDPGWGAEKLVLELFGELVEPELIQPTFVCDYPPSAQPLARPHRSEPGLVEAWDLIIGGMERGTGFTELVDPVVQREVLTAQSLAAAAGDPEAMQLDEDFLNALEFGCPPMGGLGLGIDRLVMLFTGAGIRETILFPLLKPQG